MLLVLVLMVSGLTTLLLVVSASAWAYATRLMLAVLLVSLVLCLLLHYSYCSMLGALTLWAQHYYWWST